MKCSECERELDVVEDRIYWVGDNPLCEKCEWSVERDEENNPKDQ